MPAARPGRNLDPTSLHAIAERLAITRQALGHTTTEMCRRMGSVSHGSAYTNYEMARRRISIDHALELCRTCSLTMDWIYRGDASLRLREEIQRLLVRKPSS
ncbi:MAG TPA: helix-turn-helix transcriptional regulator [Hyphomicrobiaceae bacterium]|nr:helix-turn-helix transcriptional regulator [Hyphomicrobiaceae bacterium]